MQYLKGGKEVIWFRSKIWKIEKKLVDNPFKSKQNQEIQK